MNEKHIQTIHFYSDPVNGDSSSDVQLLHVSQVPSPVYVSQPSSPYQSVTSRSSVPIIENEDTLSTWTSCVFPDEPPSVMPSPSYFGPSDVTTPKAKASWLRHSVEEVSTKEQSSLFTPIAISVTSTASPSGNGSSKNNNVTSDKIQPHWDLNPPSPPAGVLSSPEVQSPLELDALPTISPTPSTPISLSTIAPARQVPWSQWGGSIEKAVSRPSLPHIATRLRKAPIESVKSSVSTSLARDLVLLGFDKGNNSLLNTQAPDLSSPALMHDLSWKFDASMDLSHNGAHLGTRNDQWHSVQPTYQKAVTRPSSNSSSTSTLNSGPDSEGRSSTIESPLSASTVAAVSLHCPQGLLSSSGQPSSLPTQTQVQVSASHSQQASSSSPTQPTQQSLLSQTQQISQVQNAQVPQLQASSPSYLSSQTLTSLMSEHLQQNSTPATGQQASQLQPLSIPLTIASQSQHVPSHLPLPNSTQQTLVPMQLPISNASQSWPPAPSSCRPYSSLQMFANMADGSGDNGLLGAQGHPRPTTSAGFPGMSILGWANQQRLDHASTSLSHNPIKRMEKSEWKRGKAICPLSLLQRGPPEQKIEECVLKAAGGEQVVNLDSSVHLLRPKTALGGFSPDSLDLFHHYPNLPITTTIFDIFSDIVQKLRTKYNLPSLSTSLLLPPHEHLPIQLLAYSNNGHSNGTHKNVKMHISPFDINTTLENLLSDGQQFAIPRFAMTRDNHFHLQAIICQYPLEANVALATTYLGLDETVRAHRCLSKHFLSMFRNDVDANLDPHALDEEELEASCDEGDSNDEDAEVVAIVAHSLVAVPTNNLQNTSSTSSAPTSQSGLNVEDSESYLPQLWSEEFVQLHPLDWIPEFDNVE
ncbi:hypothetical protein F5876DRAFT_74951 [Lentinula aff. lateritia]|uniref:Uncharacterized protein n=1 Tax=Lentinula aff. lateritia TaxID=2804960 RepID=A0ACC1U5T3_9AGAR|nr:hypothetical protein F5876DRAFT_74951 [Lentinula aff. lateritia]